MTREDLTGAPDEACPVLPPALVTGYASGELALAQAWSVEAHVPG